MAKVYWMGPGRPRAALADGSLVDAGNWSTGSVPGAADAVYLPGGNYTVTADSSPILGALSIGRGATLHVFTPSGADIRSLELRGDSTNDGTLRISGSVLALDATLLNFGTLLADNFGGFPVLSGGTVVNAGLLTLGDLGGNVVYVGSTLQNDTAGTIAVFGSTLNLVGTVTNDGAVVVESGQVRFASDAGTGTLTNLANSALTGGSWTVTSNGSIPGTVALVGTRITLLAGDADITLGRNSQFAVTQGGTQYSLESTLRRIDPDAALHVVGGRDYTAGGALDVHGRFELGGGTLTTASLTVFADGHFTGSGSVAGKASLAGAITATGTLVFDGAVQITGAVGGSGKILLDGTDNRLGGNLTVADLEIAGTSRVATDTSYAGHLTLDAIQLDLSGAQLRLTGSVDLLGATITGASTASLKLVGADVFCLHDAQLLVPVVNAGLIEVVEDTLTVSRKITGAGTFAIEYGGTLAVTAAAAVAAGQHVSFATEVGHLVIAAPAKFHASVAAFGAGDTIDLTSIAADGARLRWQGDEDGAGGTLTVIGTNGRAVFAFDDGAYGNGDFTLSDDGSGHALVTGAMAAGFAAHDHPAAFAPLHAPGIDALV